MKTKITILLLLAAFFSLNSLNAQRVMERLNRGLVAVRVSSTQTFLSWRVMGYDPDDVAFNLYRNGVLITNTPISTSSNFMDNMYAVGTNYTVKTVINGAETGESHSATVLANNFIEIPLNRPAAMTMPDGTTCTYSPNDASVGDVNGDGNFEIILKWDPSNARDNAHAGYTGNVFIDCYRLDGTFLWRVDLGRNIRAGAAYTQMVVADFDGDGRAELAVKTAPGTRDGLGNFISKGPAATANHNADFRNTSGYILTGPEYLTVFNGLTGEEMATVNYDPQRGSVSAWGDSYGNRVDRFLASAAWLDGVLPSIVMMRGIYTRAVIAAWDYRNGQLIRRWIYDSNITVGMDGQGFHSTSVADVTNNGRDDIIWGSAALNHNGQMLYRTGHGHGDAMHVSDMDPDRPGLEVFSVKESTGSPFGYVLHDARTGQVIWGTRTGTDVGRGLAANVLANNRGFEMWSTGAGGIFDIRGNQVSTTRPSINFRIYWTGDLQSELLDGTSITKFQEGTVFSPAGMASNNGTKSTPSLSADIFGDWREEVIFRTSDDTRLRIFTTTALTQHKMYTLMHDDVYRNAIIWQNVGYNQPPHAGFYIGADMDIPPASAVYNNELRWRSGSSWDTSTSNWTDSVGQQGAFRNGNKVLFDLTAGTHSTIALQGNISPAYLKFNSPFNVEINGPGSLTGNMYVRKTGTGRLVFNGNNTFTGKVTAWSGELHNNGTLASSEVSVRSFTTLFGEGRFLGNVTLGHNSNIVIGRSTNQASSMRIMQNLREEGRVEYSFDFQINNGVMVAHDTLIIGGNWTMNNRNTFNFNIVGGHMPAGSYPIARVGGNIIGNLSAIAIRGIPANLSYHIQFTNGELQLIVRNPVRLTWNGTVDARWDMANTSNWLLGDQQQFFMANDTAVFTDQSAWKTVITHDTLVAGHTIVDASANYSIGGTGSIAGSGGLTKQGTGTLTLSSSNAYTGVTHINEGTVQVSTLSDGGVNSPIGSAPAASENIRFNGGRLHYTGASRTINRGMFVNTNGGTISVNTSTTTLSTSGRITGPGALIKEGSGRFGTSVANTHTGGTIIRAGSIELLNDAANMNGLGTGPITLQGGTITMFNSEATSNTSIWNLVIPVGSTGSVLTDGNSTISGTITGGGTLNYNTNFNQNMLSADASQFTGIINVTTGANGGDFVVFNANGYPNSRIHLSNRVRMIFRTNPNLTVQIGELTGHSGSVLGSGGTTNGFINWEVGARNTDATFAGIINNSQFAGMGATSRITKVGTGTWTLTNANIYSGGTTVNNGVMMVNNTAGSGLGTGAVVVNNGGTLSGSGSVSGDLTINAGAVIAPGNGVGLFSIGSNLTVMPGGIWEIDINKDTSTNDLLQVSGTFNMNGTLRVNVLNNAKLVPGDEFIIAQGIVNGLPQEIVPAVPPGDGDLGWDLTELAQGKLKVRSTTGVNTPELIYAVFPNPFTDQLQVRLAQTKSNIVVTIYNLTGSRMLQETSTNTDRIIMSTATLNRGSYIIEIRAGEYFATQKLFKK